MKLGAFVMPSPPPERALLAGYRWDLEQLVLLDRLGFHEAWIGEHFTAPWEPNPAPDLLIAQALPRTQRIKLCPGAHLLPYHHPIELAHRVAFLDQLAQGRYMLGGIAGLSPGSETLKIAGERGFIPLSISLNPAHTASHWTSVEAGAARSGRSPDRREWRLVGEVYVAATDDEAKRRAREGAMGRCWRDYLLPFYVGSGMGPQFLAHPSHSIAKLDVAYLIEQSWFVGSPQTVIDKIGALQRHTGGFGGLLIMLYDFSTEPRWWEESLHRLVEEVLPHFPD